MFNETYNLEVFAVASEQQELSQQEAMKKIGTLIKDIRIAMLTTADEDGRLHSRPMATQESDFDGVLWFVTREHSGKVGEIRNDAHVNLTYSDKTHIFVSISGRAEVLRDRAKLEELWNPMYKAWFPEGKDDPEARVLRVRIDQAEYWEAPASAVIRNYKILKAAVTGSLKDVGEHQKLTLDR